MRVFISKKIFHFKMGRNIMYIIYMGFLLTICKGVYLGGGLFIIGLW